MPDLRKDCVVRGLNENKIPLKKCNIENKLVQREDLVRGIEHILQQGYNARKVNCSCVYSAYILKPVLSWRNL